MKKYKQNELMPLPHGGKREGAGRKPIAPELKKEKTVVIRIEERLLPQVKALKEGKTTKNKNTDLIKKAKETAELLREKRNDLESIEYQSVGGKMKEHEKEEARFKKLFEIEEKINTLIRMLNEIIKE